MNRQVGLLAGITMCAGLFACSTYTTSTDYNHQFDFASLESFTWKTHPAGGSTFAYDPLVLQRIQFAIDTNLENKGYARVTGAPADFQVAVHASKTNELDIDGWGYGWGAWGADAYAYTEGTLMVDFVDSASNALIWRGTAKGTLDDEALQQKEVDEIVGKILESFPPEKKK